MMLINSLLSHVSDSRWDEFIGDLERLNVRKAVIVRSTIMIALNVSHQSLQRLMSLHAVEDLTSCILDFQANMIRVNFRKKTTAVDPQPQSSHRIDLDYIWACSKLREEVDANGNQFKWRKLGFETEDVAGEFAEVGVLGLDCLVRVIPSFVIDR